MIEHTHEDRLFQRYLLGDLAEEERERLQERYFTDARLFSRLLSAEADLIDAYGRGELTEDERKRFEQRFGNVRGIDRRLKFASMLSRAADQQSPPLIRTTSLASSRSSNFGPLPGPRVVRASFVAIAAVIMVIAALVVVTRWLPQRRQPGVELASSQTDSPAAQPTPQLNTQATPGPTGVEEKGSSAASPVTKPEEGREPPLPKVQLASVSVILSEGITRDDGQAAQVVLSQATKSLETQLELPSDLQIGTYSHYQAVLQTVAGQEVIRRDRLKIARSSSGSFVRVRIPAELLTTRDYVVLLNGQRSDGTQQYLRGYSFSITRK